LRIAERLFPASRRHIGICVQPKAYVQFGMDICAKSPNKVLKLLLSSTAHKFYISEIADCTGLARNTVCSILKRLENAELVLREQEHFNFDLPPRAPRVYYTLNPHTFHHVRFQDPST
jgi:predicted transcriptional regulator